MSLGDVYEKMGKFDKGIGLLSKALKIRRKALGESHILVAHTVDRIGQAHFNNRGHGGDLKKAVRKFREALKIFRIHKISEDDPLFVTASNHLDKAICKIRDKV